MLGRAKAVVGLDIGSSAVKAVELERPGEAYKVVGVRQPRRSHPDSIVDGAIIDATAVAEVIRAAVRHAPDQDQGRRRLAVRQRRHRQEDQPAGHDRRRAGRVDLLGSRAVHPVRHPGRQPRLPDPHPRRRRRTRGRRWTCCWSPRRRRRSPTTRASSARPAACRSSSTSTPSRSRTPTRSTTTSTTARWSRSLNAGASAININIVCAGQSLFTRDISIGGNAYTEALQKELNLPFEAAEQAKKGQHVDGVSFDDVKPVLRAVNENVLLEIQKTFDFFKSTAGSDRIDRIMLSGGASRVFGFREMLAERFGRRSSRSIRSARWRSTRRSSASRTASDVAPTAAVAVGLALRRAGDR